MGKDAHATSRFRLFNQCSWPSGPPHYWTDNPDPQLTEGKYPDAKTVNIWRVEFLKNWRERMDRAAGGAKGKELPQK